MKGWFRTAAVLLLLAGTGHGVAAQQRTAERPDPSLGTWALNVSRSQLPGPAPKLSIQRYESRADGFVVSTRIALSDTGEPQFEQAVLKHDGKDYDWWDATTLANFLASGQRRPKRLSMRTVDAFTVEFTGKEAGKTTTVGQRVVTRDGKTMTLSGKTLTPQGQWISYTAVFDKQ
jgi:hypothetical protein